MSMHTLGHLDEVRDSLSSVLYNLGWRNISAFVFTGNTKWLDPRLGLRGFSSSGSSSDQSMGDVGMKEASSSSRDVYMKTLSLAANSGPRELSAKLSARDRWRSARRLLHASWQAATMLNRMITRIKDDREGRESSLAAAEEAESRVELFTSDAREDGLRMDTDRYLRMNRANRQELVLPKLGVLGTYWCWVWVFLCVICFVVCFGLVGLSFQICCIS